MTRRRAIETNAQDLSYQKEKDLRSSVIPFQTQLVSAGGSLSSPFLGTHQHMDTKLHFDERLLGRGKNEYSIVGHNVLENDAIRDTFEVLARQRKMRLKDLSGLLNAGKQEALGRLEQLEAAKLIASEDAPRGAEDLR